MSSLRGNDLGWLLAAVDGGPLTAANHQPDLYYSVATSSSHYYCPNK